MVNYSWLAPTDGYITLSTCANDFNTVLETGDRSHNQSFCGPGRSGEMMAVALHLIDVAGTHQL